MVKKIVFLALAILLVVFAGCTTSVPSSDGVTVPDSDWPLDDLEKKYLLPEEIPAEEPTLPIISNVRVTDIDTDSAVVRWETDIPSNSKVKYGLGNEWSLTTSYSEYSSRYTTEHRIKLRDLTAGSTYCVYYVASTGSGTAEYIERLVFSTAWPADFWGNFGGGLGGFSFSGSSSTGTVTATWNGGDGSWNSDTWTVSAYPAESKHCWFRISNGTGSAVTVWIDAALVSCPAGS